MFLTIKKIVRLGEREKQSNLSVIVDLKALKPGDFLVVKTRKASSRAAEECTLI